MTKTKVFMSGGSQAVRLPAEYRFEGDEVEVRRDPLSGDVILSRPHGSWEDYFAWVETLDLPADFLAQRDQPQDELRDPFAGPPDRVPAKPVAARKRRKATT